MKLNSLLSRGVCAALLALHGHGAWAAAFGNMSSNGNTVSSISRNAATAAGDTVGVIEALLYFFGAGCMFLLVVELIKWKKSSGRDGDITMALVYFIGGILCFAAPTLMGGGLGTLFDGEVNTIKAPTPNYFK